MKRTIDDLWYTPAIHPVNDREQFMSSFSAIGLVGRLDNERAGYTLRRIIRFLQDQGIAFVLEQDTAELLADASASAAAQCLAPLASLGERCDLEIGRAHV